MSEERIQICDKRRYESREEAEKEINFLYRDLETPDLKTYKCHVCHNWHLTSTRKR